MLDGSGPAAVAVTAKVLVTEITGSESFVHLDFAGVRWVMLTHGIKNFQTDETIEVFIDSRHIMVFDEHGRSAAPRVELAA
jgi:glycerol transport system ATP-binding protein